MSGISIPCSSTELQELATDVAEKRGGRGRSDSRDEKGLVFYLQLLGCLSMSGEADIINKAH